MKESKGMSTTAQDVIYSLFKTSRQIRREFEQRLASLNMPIKLSSPRLRLLVVVAKNKPIRMNVLADKLFIKPRTVTDFVDALERDGLISRLQDPSDRRATLLELTPVAQQHMDQVLSLQNELAEQLLANFSETERTKLMELLNRLVADIQFDACRFDLEEHDDM